MIGEFLLNILFTIVSGFLALLPPIAWNPNNSFLNFLSDVVASVAYLLPMGTVAALVTISISITIFKIVVSFIKTIWDLLPIV